MLTNHECDRLLILCFIVIGGIFRTVEVCHDKWLARLSRSKRGGTWWFGGDFTVCHISWAYLEAGPAK